MTSLDIFKDASGQLPAYAWPGGYPLFYLMADGEVICSDCANGGNGSLATDVATDCSDDDQWTIVAVEINWEDTSMFCAHCAAQIESAYGNDEPSTGDDDNA